MRLWGAKAKSHVSASSLGLFGLRVGVHVASDRRAGEQGQRIAGSSPHANDPAMLLDCGHREIRISISIDCCRALIGSYSVLQENHRIRRDICSFFEGWGSIQRKLEKFDHPLRVSGADTLESLVLKPVSEARECP